MLILLLYFNSSSIGFTYCYSLEHKLHYNCYLCSEVIFKHPKGVKLELTCSNTGVIGHGHLKFTASSKLEVNYPATSIKE